MDSQDFFISRSIGPLSHPIAMDVTHKPTGIKISGTGRDDHKLMAELVSRLTEIVAGYASARTEAKTDDQVIAETLHKTLHKTLHLSKKAANV